MAKTDRGLASHLAKCRHAAAGLAAIADDMVEHEPHQRPTKRPRISPPEHLEAVVLDPDQEMVVSLEVRLRIKNPVDKGTY